jgi:isoleucyl-tRNA synthetase
MRRTCRAGTATGCRSRCRSKSGYGKNIAVEETQRLARIYAGEQIVRQKADFQRLGVLGDWKHPYTTMAFKTEADEIRTLGRILEKGFIYRGLKPVNWCFDCGSALAEAEVEYEERTDIAVDVAFPIEDADRAKLAAAFGSRRSRRRGDGDDLDDDALDDSVEPGAQRPPRSRLRAGRDAARAPRARAGARRRVPRAVQARRPHRRHAKGAALERIRFRHPLYDRPSPVYLGAYVTLDQGTGIVHSSPAYGVEDFLSCRRYGMKDDEILNPVGADGRFAASLPLFGGENIWKANPHIVDKLRSAGALLSEEKFTHSYMHCWRHRTPIIYRATTQWFVGMDDVPGWHGVKPATTLRETALAGIEATEFFPAWGKARLYGMIANRPDWTLSRQRQWGVPMPFFIHKETGALHPRTLELLEQVAQRVEKSGIEAWQTLDPHELDADDLDQYDKVKDTVDVWFDSGSTHQTVMGGPNGRATGAGSHAKETGFPADLYLEGSDQHRGWFHSSLLVSCMLNGVPPYRALPHARLRRRRRRPEDVEIEGQRHRAAGGVEHARRRDPRLWVASTDYSGELSISTRS